jgi:long-chain acyl-CoA synthetase
VLYEMLAATAAAHAAAPALIERRRRLTFAQLLELVDRFAAVLAGAGVGEGDAVVLLLPNGIEFVVAAHAVTRIGGMIVPLNPQFQEWELRQGFRDCRARAVVTTPARAPQCSAIVKAAEMRCALFTSVETGNGPAAESGRRRRPRNGAALCQYSSGSTGLPKRAVRTQANLVAEAEHFAATVGLTAEDRILAVVPLFHAHGFGNCLLANARSGAPLVLLDSFVRRPVIEALVRERVTVFPGVPFMFGILAASPFIRDGGLGALRLAFSAGAPLPREAFDGFREKFGIPVRQLYGSTETGSVTINLGSCDGELWSSVGRPMVQVEVRVAAASGIAVRPGEVGEILVRSPATTSGYAELPEVNAETFRDGYFWTGDLGRIDAGGNLFVTGRKKLYIDTGGYKIDPYEVEAVLNAHASVAESVVVGVKTSQGREVVKAVVVLRAACTARELQDWCLGKIAEFKIPRIVEFRTEIPKSPLGKILRKYLAAGDAVSEAAAGTGDGDGN